MPNHHSKRYATTSSEETSSPRVREMGLAVYARDSDGSPITRSFRFQDDLVENFSEGFREQGRQDDRSNCTLFEDCDHHENTSHACHCYKDTKIDEHSWVYNGSFGKEETSQVIRKHHLNGGSVSNGSKLVNGDLTDKEVFLAFFSSDSTKSSTK